MRLISYKNRKENDIQTGLLINDDQELIPLITLGLPSDMNDLIKIDFEEIQNKISLKNDETSKLSLSDVKILSPIPRPLRNIMCVGKNYHDHAQEFYGSGFDSSGKKAVADFPVIFTKATTSVIATSENIVLANDYTNTTDYEGELGLVLRKGGKNIKAEDAYDHVFGYTIINDVTARKLQNNHKQWFIGKSPDTYCPIGPCIITKDEIKDIKNIKIQTTINGEIRQTGIVKDMIFNISTIIETLTKSMTLLEGDIIATGTPSGVGIGFDPPKFLKSGDKIKISIDPIGILENDVI